MVNNSVKYFVRTCTTATTTQLPFNTADMLVLNMWKKVKVEPSDPRFLQSNSGKCVCAFNDTFRIAFSACSSWSITHVCTTFTLVICIVSICVPLVLPPSMCDFRIANVCVRLEYCQCVYAFSTASMCMRLVLPACVCL